MQDFISTRRASVLIVGLGETGAAAALWCARRGDALRVVDTRAEPTGIAALRAALAQAQVEYCLGVSVFGVELLAGIDQVVLSPGLPPNQPVVAELLSAARERNIEIIGEIELFARALSDLRETHHYTPRLLAVTGTNGKTTVTALTRHLVQACGLTVRAAGNISPAALSALMDALDQNDLPDVWVLELSSFQLETTRSLSPDAAVVLNVTQDHLDWHGSMTAYAHAKSRVYERANVRIVNRDDALVLAMVTHLDDESVRSFGRGVPPLVGDMGLEGSHGVRWLAAGAADDFDATTTAVASRRRKVLQRAVRATARTVRMMPVDALRLRGRHNALNAQAALLLARSIGLPWSGLLRAVRDYAGEPHRMAFVRSVAGVDFIDDSKGTNVGATVAGLEGLDGKVVLIAGGLGKGQDFSPLAVPVAQHTRAVVLIGQDAELLAQALADTGVVCKRAESLPQAVARAFELAHAGDGVLLSPACASMDMFRSYVHRGQVYAEAVQELALNQGEIA